MSKGAMPQEMKHPLILFKKEHVCTVTLNSVSWWTKSHTVQCEERVLDYKHQPSEKFILTAGFVIAIIKVHMENKTWQLFPRQELFLI